jgi:hypothetical protein
MMLDNALILLTILSSIGLIFAAVAAIDDRLHKDRENP